MECRGLNKLARRKDVADHVFKLSSSFILLTKVNLHNSHRITSCIPHCWSSCYNCDCTNTARIWVFWNQGIWSCTLLAKSSQQITLPVINQASFQGIFTIVYGSNWQSGRQALSKELCQISRAYAHLPWAVMGDFNIARFR